MAKKKTLILSIAIIILIISMYSYTQHTNNRQVLENSHTIKSNSSNILSLMYEASSGSGEYVVSNSSSWPNEGYTFNERLSKCENGSELTWDDTTKEVVLKGNISDKCYVYFDLVPLKYWNDDFSNSGSYYFPDTPSKAYSSLAALQAGYSAFVSYPFYIKTTTEHQVCVYYKETGKEFCMSRNYLVSGDSDGSQSKAKLKGDMEKALNLTIEDTDCSSDSSYAYCTVSYFGCGANSDGDVYCYGGTYGCSVYGDGGALCASL